MVVRTVRVRDGRQSQSRESLDFGPPSPDVAATPVRIIQPRKITWPTRLAILIAATSAGGVAASITGIIPEAHIKPPAVSTLKLDFDPAFTYDADKAIYDNGVVKTYPTAFRMVLRNTFTIRQIEVYDSSQLPAHVAVIDFIDPDSGLSISGDTMAAKLTEGGQHGADLTQIEYGIGAAHRAGRIPDGALVIMHDGNGYVDDALPGISMQFNVSSDGSVAELPSP